MFVIPCLIMTNKTDKHGSVCNFYIKREAVLQACARTKQDWPFANSYLMD